MKLVDGPFGWDADRANEEASFFVDDHIYELWELSFGIVILPFQCVSGKSDVYVMKSAKQETGGKMSVRSYLHWSCARYLRPEG